MSRRELPILTRAESELMACFWERGPMTVQQLHAHFADRAYTSLATLVKILEQKGYLKHQASEGRAFIFAPAVKPEAARRHHLRDLVDRLFGGRTEQLVAGLLEEEQLSDDELRALRREIDARLQKEKKR